jgi:hypothetical protein
MVEDTLSTEDFLPSKIPPEKQCRFNGFSEKYRKIKK